jgi:hypothetical protein
MPLLPDSVTTPAAHYASTVSIRGAMREFKISSTAIRRRMKELGLPSKPIGMAPVHEVEMKRRVVRAVLKQGRKRNVTAASRSFGVAPITIWRWLKDPRYNPKAMKQAA